MKELSLIYNKKRGNNKFENNKIRVINLKLSYLFF